MPQTPETYLPLLARWALHWTGLWGLMTSLGIWINAEEALPLGLPC